MASLEHKEMRMSRRQRRLMYDVRWTVYDGRWTMDDVNFSALRAFLRIENITKFSRMRVRWHKESIRCYAMPLWLKLAHRALRPTKTRVARIISISATSKNYQSAKREKKSWGERSQKKGKMGGFWGRKIGKMSKRIRTIDCPLSKKRVFRGAKFVIRNS